MPLIYMQHKEHGNHIVYSEDEAVANEKNGWVRSEFPTAKKAVEQVETRRGPGRPKKD